MSSAADGASVAAERDGLGLLLHVLEELDSALQLPAVDSLGGLAGVLEGDTEVGTAGAGRLGGSDLGGSVPNLFTEKTIMSVLQLFLKHSSNVFVRWACRPARAGPSTPSVLVHLIHSTCAGVLQSQSQSNRPEIESGLKS